MYYDYAESVLDDENFMKFTDYVDQAFSLKKFGTIYFYGTGGNGKTTLINKMLDNYPAVFGKGSNSRVKVYEDGSPVVGRLPAKGEGSVIVVMNTLPEGIHPDRIISFKKRF